MSPMVPARVLSKRETRDRARRLSGHGAAERGRAGREVMPRFVALLRGINVGGNRIIKMERLREIFTGAGALDVQSYLQSGNVVFSHPRPTSTRFERAIAEATGLEVPVILRSAAEIAALAHPFAGDADVHGTGARSNN
jgi:uncharacterized protein (DUF1697 family)